MTRLWVLLLIPAVARAGVSYHLAVRPVEQSLSLASTPAPAAVTEFFVDHGRVRVVSPRDKTVYVFKDRTLVVIDHAARTVHVLKHATLADITAHYADAIAQLEAAAAKAPADERSAALQKATDMKAVSARLLQSIPRDFRLTVRFESVDGHACRVWEERENGAKRLELCVAPTTSIPGGAEILAGMKTLSQFRQGSDCALGVNFGLANWWPDVAALGGVPLLVREYKYDSVLSETLLSDPQVAVLAPGLFDPPDGYSTQEGPDYAQWYLR